MEQDYKYVSDELKTKDAIIKAIRYIMPRSYLITLEVKYSSRLKDDSRRDLDRTRSIIDFIKELKDSSSYQLMADLIHRHSHEDYWEFVVDYLTPDGWRFLWMRVSEETVQHLIKKYNLKSL